ncbi:Hsp70 family protein [Cerasicoccus arenae]|uniref:Heat-shock protein n=1 Tax=Cerasicoccus arenae TaxID=424488 RepID=A0A8J3DD82_9BACT|nr:Hsp70 family protein [Cerasicoccus arenae]MBK1857652.1 Hsp70 family protein [Cerasicoccus arenae]GHC12847.1 heat-shock protein [Cerasicoccus arenae]
MNETHCLGIDLGTSNSALTLASLDERVLSVLPVTQAFGPHSVGEQAGLPSALYLPNEGEFEDDAFSVPGLDSTKPGFVGRFAREHGAQSPDRLVTSAKSWLCHGQIDHRQPILPWGSISVPTEQKVSPLTATQRYLEVLKASVAPLESTQVVLTVPASFDEAARQLTLEAAQAAGLGDVILMEEPQAAFYAWLEKMGGDWRSHVKPGDLVLVCDVGGGTSDFSLIAVSDSGGELQLERVSVGEHILLGGDNLDLALAFALRAQIEAEGASIDDWQFLALIHSARVGKEQLFSDLSLPEVPIAVPSRGSSLFAGTVSTTLGRDLLEQIALQGFLPLTAPSDMPQTKAAGGLKEFGLDYAADPVLSKHLARFLKRSLDNVRSSETLSAQLSAEALSGELLAPSAVLFNGGFFNADPARARVLELLRSWSSAEVRELAGSDYALAVAQGACYYGLSKLSGKGVRIKAGASRSYYLGLETTMMAIPGFKPPVKGICVVPQGMEEGTEAVLGDQEFGLVLGQEVSFRFFSSTARAGDAVGTVLPNAEKELEETAAVQTVLEPVEGLTAGEAIPVKLHSCVTEVGALELWMQHTRSDARWKLEFSVRTE